MHTESMLLMRFLLHQHCIQRRKTVCDIGSRCVGGNGDTYRKMCVTQFGNYYGIDLVQGRNVNAVVTEDGNWVEEVGGRMFDIVISGQCLEHVKRPWEWIKKAKTLMKPGALLVIIAPYCWRIHRYPVDCWRILPDGMHALIESAHLQPITTGHLPHSSNPGSRGDCFGVSTNGHVKEKPFGKQQSVPFRNKTIHFTSTRLQL